MKKLILLVMMLMLASSCEYENPRNPDSSVECKEEFVARHCSLIDLTFEEETHQYVFFMVGYEGSVSHWAGCKYCKQNNSVKTNE